MKTQHTPGPWRAEGCMVYAGENRVARTWSGTQDGIPTPTMFADARLIAAAPDLLAALKAALEWLRAARADEPDDWDTSDLDDAIRMGRSAVAKAKGGAK